MPNRIGFMQGRLSPIVDGKIQAFPWDNWQQEFALASRNDILLIEWTLDQQRLYENPLMNKEGQAQIKKLMQECSVDVKSLTGDCFMQAPFYKQDSENKERLLTDLKNIIESCGALEIESVLIPLVDAGRLETEEQKQELIKGLVRLVPLLDRCGVKILFESDYAPKELAEFIDQFDRDYFGLTYDIGNSASLGFNFKEEFDAYFDRIENVHVKDRKRAGTTVALTEGDADIPGVIKELTSRGYEGNFILQTARAQNDDHLGVLCKYRDMVSGWLNENLSHC